RHRALLPLELLEVALQVARVGDEGPIGEGGQRLDPQIHPHHRTAVHRNVMLHLHQDRDIPVSGLLADRGRANTYATGRQIVALFEPCPPQTRYLDGVREHDDGSRKTEAAEAFLPGLRLRVADLAPQFPSRCNLTRRKKWAKAASRLRKASCGAHLETSYIQ